MYRETAQSEKLYTKVAHRYNRIFERAILSERRLTDLARERFDGRRVLDLACGNGRWLDRFRPLAYVGIDLSARMLAEGKRRYPHATFLRGDMTRLPFADRAFEGVMSMFGAMGHLPPEGQRRMIQEAWRVLAPGGSAIFTNGNTWSPFNLPTTLRGNRVRLEGVRFKVHSSNPRLLRALLAEEGFEVVRLESYDYSYIPMLPLKFGACLVGRDYRAVYESVMEVYDHCRHIPNLRWFGKQLAAVCRKG
jgi:SAM-dependent methyltransferase